MQNSVSTTLVSSKIPEIQCTTRVYVRRPPLKKTSLLVHLLQRVRMCLSRHMYRLLLIIQGSDPRFQSSIILFRFLELLSELFGVLGENMVEIESMGATTTISACCWIGIVGWSIS